MLTLGIIALISAFGGIFVTCCCASAFAPAGIVGIVVEFITLAVGIPAWVFGHVDLRKMRAGHMDPSGQGITMTGFVMGIISVVLAGVIILVSVALFILGLLGLAAFSMMPRK